MLVPVVLIIIAALIIISAVSSVGSAYSNVVNGGQVVYDEPTFQDYANEQYSLAFSAYDGYEDNLLIAFLANEEKDGYYCIAWVGYNVADDINNMLGDETTAFGRLIIANVNSEYYAHSLDKNLATAVTQLCGEITELGLQSSFAKPETHTNPAKSHLVNYTDMEMSESTVNDALNDFTEKTGIPVVIAVDYMEKVIGKTISGWDIFCVIFSIALIAYAVYLIVRNVRSARAERQSSTNSANGGTNSSNNGYNMFNDNDF